MPTSSNNFSTLALKTGLLNNLPTLGYKQMTPIQAQSLPSILEGKDVIGQGKTGSGKTAAFGLGLLQNLEEKKFRVQSLVLCPTRELADQVAKEVRRLARGIHNIKVLTLCGGSPLGPQIGSLEHGAHIIVGTPGRVEDHLRKERLNLDNLNTLVLDEADRMLDMGFQESLANIMDYCPKQRQTLLFSATFPEGIQSIAHEVMNNPTVVKVASTENKSNIEQHFYQVDNHAQRMHAVKTILLANPVESTIVFCTTKQDTDDLAYELADEGFSAAAIHGDLEQRERDRTLAVFANKSTSILVATDVAARGLDINKLDMVINFQVSRDPEVHVHRIGRTGRAGNHGLAFSLLTKKDHYLLTQIEEYTAQQFSVEHLPTTSNSTPTTPSMITLEIDGGKKQKIRPGDILGALTAGKHIDGSLVGKINIFYGHSLVAIHEDAFQTASKIINESKLKGKQFKARRLRL